MTIYDFDEEYSNLTIERRKEFLGKIFKNIVDNLDNENFEDMVSNWLLPVLLDFEAEDGFGTEGFIG